jgi:hypothetical protein
MDRSMYQRVQSIRIDAEVAVTRLVDELNGNKITLIAVHLVPGFRLLLGPEESSSPDAQGTAGLRYSRAAFDLGDICDDISGGDDNWYVYRRRRDGICVVHQGSTIEGGDLAWERFFGPGTKEEADRAWSRCDAS